MSDAALTPEDRRLQGEIDALRDRFSDTQDLYREVCVLLFFRHGVTPTANKLYQLVRKGSMSAPAEALAKFWAALREKSRVRIEHPDLPEELRDAAGEAIGALWQRAQVLADANLATARGDAQAAAIEAKAAAETAQARADAAESTANETKTELASALARVQQLEQDLAREQGARETLERQSQQGEEQRRELQRALEDTRMGFERQLAEQLDAAKTSEERHQADMRRTLLDIDRERSGSAQLKKELDQAQRSAAEQMDRHRARAEALEGELAIVRQRLSGAEAALAEARAAGDQLRTHLGNALTRPSRSPSAIKKRPKPSPKS